MDVENGAAKAGSDVHIPSAACAALVVLDRIIAASCDVGEAVNIPASSTEDIARAAAVAAGMPLAIMRTMLEARLDAIRTQRAQLLELLKTPGIAQRTPAWYEARGELITASDAAQALGCAKFGNQRQFFAKKCGYEKEAFNPNVPPLKWGTMYEWVACSAYSLRCGSIKVHEFGLLRHPREPHLGASPDGINDFGVMVEIKCPYRRKANGTIPWQYYCQIQGQLDVCNLTDCDYVECELQEYDGWSCLEQDCSPCGRFSQDGGEHGFVLEIPSADP